MAVTVATLMVRLYPRAQFDATLGCQALVGSAGRGRGRGQGQGQGKVKGQVQRSALSRSPI